jgi:uncharacterized membrane protein
VQAAPLAPADYRTAGTLMLISGIFNVLVSAGILLGLLLSVVGLCVAPIWLFTLGGGIAEIVVGAGIMQGSRSLRAMPVAVVGLVSGVVCGNMLGMILEILAMVQLGKPEVHAFIHGVEPAPALPPPPRDEPPQERRPPADFPQPRPRRDGPSVSWTGDLPLVQKDR